MVIPGGPLAAAPFDAGTALLIQVYYEMGADRKGGWYAARVMGPADVNGVRPSLVASGRVAPSVEAFSARLGIAGLNDALKVLSRVLAEAPLVGRHILIETPSATTAKLLLGISEPSDATVISLLTTAQTLLEGCRAAVRVAHGQDLLRVSSIVSNIRNKREDKSFFHGGGGMYADPPNTPYPVPLLIPPLGALPEAFFSPTPTMGPRQPPSPAASAEAPAAPLSPRAPPPPPAPPSDRNSLARRHAREAIEAVSRLVAAQDLRALSAELAGESAGQVFARASSPPLSSSGVPLRVFSGAWPCPSPAELGGNIQRVPKELKGRRAQERWQQVSKPFWKAYAAAQASGDADAITVAVIELLMLPKLLLGTTAINKARGGGKGKSKARRQEALSSKILERSILLNRALANQATGGELEDLFAGLGVATPSPDQAPSGGQGGLQEAAD